MHKWTDNILQILKKFKLSSKSNKVAKHAVKSKHFINVKNTKTVKIVYLVYFQNNF